MSDEPERFPLTRSTLRARVLMVGVFVGALVAMSLSWVFSWGLETPEDRARQAQELAVARREAAFSSPPGSCLTWDKADASDVRKVSCTTEHLFEVVGVVNISDEYPRNARHPDEQTWRTIAQQRCGQSAGEYLKKPLDPFGKLTVGVLRPDRQQWAQGDRKLHCGLQWVAPGGEMQPLTQPAAEINQSNVWEPGTCLGLVGKTVGDPVPCSQEHSYEIIGLVDLAEEFEGFPPPDKQKTWLDRRCSAIAKRYTGGADLGKQGLILSWDVRERPSWKAGSTLVNCKVAATLEDKSGLAPVRGSVHKDAAPPEKDSGAGDRGNGDAGDNGDSQDGGDRNGGGRGGENQNGPGQGEQLPQQNQDGG
ncbi:septum formation family protein [Prauserella muralis]|uniref:Septum formation-related domain-containing protein n=1 Tax=Prauserella muralis TaxID=588067 RepID=A0A2V4BFC3_9PSEU|nr:septum formation family protein [Prauserella muralis]PXY32749.1 hypothetical protein BAY60_05675 [Prauserella muralis]